MVKGIRKTSICYISYNKLQSYANFFSSFLHFFTPFKNSSQLMSTLRPRPVTRASGRLGFIFSGHSEKDWQSLAKCNSVKGTTRKLVGWGGGLN